MAGKTSQLQIRVTETEKASLRRLAGAAGTSVSRYVLAMALPSRDLELTRAVEGLVRAGTRTRPAFEELASLILATPPEDFAASLTAVPIAQLNSTARNQVAAMVEQAAYLKAVDPPTWVDEVEPLLRPHFGWPLSSLRPHQIRITPAPFKRRGVFFDPASPRGVPAARPAPPVTSEPPTEAMRRLKLLAQELASLELKVEFYFLGGAVLFQAFQARPETAHISALFEPADTVMKLLAELQGQEEWPDEWLNESVKSVLAGGARRHRYVELPGLSVFVPPLEYVLAVKVAALRVGQGARRLDDIRYVIRALNLGDVEAVLGITRRYFSGRQLAQDTRATLDALLAS